MLQNEPWPIDESPTLIKLTAEFHLIAPWTDDQLAWVAKVVVHIRTIEYELSHYCGDLEDPMDIEVPFPHPSYGFAPVRNARIFASRKLLGLPGWCK